MDFRSFCERVAKSTTFNRQEVEAVLNYATEIARDIVEFGDLGTLSPSFKSKVVPVGEVFNVQKHIEKPVVRLSPSRKYFTLTDVTYEQTTAKPKKGKTEPTSFFLHEKNTKHNERNKIYFCFIFVTFKQLTYISFLKYIKQARNTLTKKSV